jgi:hypothetical protein
MAMEIPGVRLRASITAAFAAVRLDLNVRGAFVMRAVVGVAIVVVGILAAPSNVAAQERLGDGAMGAVAGAIVAGPFGALAGGLVGVSVGPAIARSWGLHHHRRYREARRATHPDAH